MGNEIQDKLDELKQKGWTLASIAREIGQSSRAVESWNQGVRFPANLRPVIDSLDRIAKMKRIPKQKIYPHGIRKKAQNDLPKFKGEFDNQSDRV